MDRRILFGAFVLLAGCQTDPGTAPEQQQPSFVISDGARAGNPDFFFLPPLVGNPRANPNWTVGGFNPALRPTVAICALNLPTAAPASAVLATTPCKPGGYAVNFPFGTTGAVVKLHGSGNGDPDDDQGEAEDGGHYHLNWKVPKSSDVFYRIRVLVGARVLGFADVHSVTSGSGLKSVNTGAFVARKDGSNAPIKFRIENRALCDNPGGTDPCTTAAVNLGTGGTVVLTTDPLFAPAGVIIPPQPDLPQTVVATIQPCADFNPRVTDLPTFGSCLQITLEPALTQALTVPATVFVCDYPPDVSALSAAQSERVTLHRLLTTGAVEALPHAEALCPPPVASFSTRAKGILRFLADGRYRAAGEQLAGLIGPTPLLALDRGGGGLVRGFSDFQFALPGKLTIAAGDGQAGFAGAALPVNPTVLVTDLAGDPVAGARVTFAGTGAVGTSPVLTDGAGLAEVSWAVAAGANSLTASGRGIGGADNNGPRPGIDPFMAIQDPFDPGILAPWSPVTLLTGSQVFAATGVAPAALPFGDLATDYFYRVVPFGAEPDFFLGGLGTGFSLGNAGFGTANSGCELNANVASGWPLDTDILVRKQFVVPDGASAIRISIAIDNDVRVFLDGAEITAFVDSPPGSLLDGFLQHEGCPSNGSFTFVRSVGSGLHEIAIRGRDRGGQAYLDARVEVVVPPS